MTHWYLCLGSGCASFGTMALYKSYYYYYYYYLLKSENTPILLLLLLLLLSLLLLVQKLTHLAKCTKIKRQHLIQLEVILRQFFYLNAVQDVTLTCFRCCSHSEVVGQDHGH